MRDLVNQESVSMAILFTNFSGILTRDIFQGDCVRAAIYLFIAESNFSVVCSDWLLPRHISY